MVNLRSFEVPTVVKHAPGAVECLADEIKALGCKRPMLVTDGGLVKAGIAARVTDVLKAGNVDYLLFDGVIANPPIRLVNEAAMDRAPKPMAWKLRARLGTKVPWYDEVEEVHR